MNKSLDEFWTTDLEEVCFFGKTKKECKECLDEILEEYSELIKRMKYV